jgi:hypothetical protein
LDKAHPGYTLINRNEISKKINPVEKDEKINLQGDF